MQQVCVVDRFVDAVVYIKNKNNGGCLLMCYCFYKWLIAQGLPTDSFQVVQYDGRWGGTAEHNMNWIKSGYGDPSSSDHFSWMYEGEEYDSEGPHSLEDRWPGDVRQELTGLNTKHSCLVEKFCLEALQKGVWNVMFNRAESIPLLEQALGIDLSEVPHGCDWW